MKRYKNYLKLAQISLSKLQINASSKEMDRTERRKVGKIQSIIENMLIKWYNWLIMFQEP